MTLKFDSIAEFEDFVNLFHTGLGSPSGIPYFDILDAKLDQLLEKENQELMTLDELQAQVTETNTVAASAVTLIQGIAAQLLECKNDPAKIAELAASLKGSSDALAAAVTANTPSA